jgi:tRNA(Ile)-lysidine synthase
VQAPDTALIAGLRKWRELRPQAAWAVALSGGAHSAALLKLAKQCCDEPAARAPLLRALHVHHGLPASDALAAAASAICARLQVPLQILRVQVVDTQDEGLEAAARRARYTAFAATLSAGELLLLAHHEWDQAETVLLRLLRGSGPTGLAAMREVSALGAGERVRPWLTLSEPVIRAQAEGLPYMDDPMNADTRFDRVYLRERVLPLLRERWPRAASLLARSAALAAQLTDEPKDPWPTWFDPTRRMQPAAALMALSQSRRHELLRLWVRELGYLAPELKHWHELDRALFGARSGRAAVVRTGQLEWRLTRQALYVGPILSKPVLAEPREFTGDLLHLGEWGQIRWAGQAARTGLAPWQLCSATSVAPFELEQYIGSKSASVWLKQFNCPAWVRDRALVLCADGAVIALMVPGLTLWTPAGAALRGDGQLDWHCDSVWLADREG